MLNSMTDRRISDQISVYCLNNPGGKRWIAFRTSTLLNRSGSYVDDGHSRPVQYSYGIVSDTPIEPHDAEGLINGEQDSYRSSLSSLRSSWGLESSSASSGMNHVKPGDAGVSNQKIDTIKPSFGWEQYTIYALIVLSCVSVVLLIWCLGDISELKRNLQRETEAVNALVKSIKPGVPQ